MAASTKAARRRSRRNARRRRRPGRAATAGAVALATAAVPSVAAAAGGTSHVYRHGEVPFRAPPGALVSGGQLAFGGGVAGVGVVTSAPSVYVVFWGSQWGSSATDSHSDVTLSGDPQGMAPYLQEFYKGLGSEPSNEDWSGVMTQYCQGVATGATTCPSNAAHVSHPGKSGALAGVWVDESAAAPAQASAHQLGQEAVNAASHFGNGASNAQFVIVSPTGTQPDGFNQPSSNFCAWHDYTGDSSLDGGGAVQSSFDVAFTNLPYLTDAGSSCGENFVNSGSAGTLDGVSIVGGHEYAETITDPFPAGGWTDRLGSEDGDKCAWITSGQGAAQDISLSTGSFAVQSTWANDFNSGAGGCEISHPIVTGS